MQGRSRRIDQGCYMFITARTAPPLPPPPILVPFAELPMRLFVPLKCSELADTQIAPP